MSPAPALHYQARQPSEDQYSRATQKRLYSGRGLESVIISLKVIEFPFDLCCLSGDLIKGALETDVLRRASFKGLVLLAN